MTARPLVHRRSWYCVPALSTTTEGKEAMNEVGLFDLFAEAEFKDALDARLITIREDGAGLRILNYSDSAIYTDGAWDNPAVRICRGLIVDELNVVRARPWAKFFNYGQREAGDLDLAEPVEVTDKADGSLGIVHLAADGQQRVATRGSFESDQAIHATSILRGRYPALMSLRDVTPLVEIVYPENRIVVDYGGMDDLVLLGGVDVATGDYISPAHVARLVGWSGPIVETFDYPTLKDALAAPERPGMEGLCVRYLRSNQIVKIKQAEYVRLHKIVTGLSERSVWEHMSEGRPLEDMLAELPDELHVWTRDVWNDLSDDLDEIHNNASLAHLEILRALPEGWERKHYAEATARHARLRPYLFNLLDDRDPRPAILKTLKPFGDTRARAVSEAVA